MPIEERHTGICINCHKEKLLWGDNLCSQRCRNEQKSNRKYSICRNCGKHLPKPKRGPMREYCDRKCKSAYQTKQRKLMNTRHAKGQKAASGIVSDLNERIRERRDLQREKTILREQAAVANQDNERFIEHIDTTRKD
ncbi:hypothetical protein COO72_05400 [Bifidobacterium callitrichos]|nr:hypothetical protein COO72_05400 [Bifidobacterium callitrichos]